MFDWLYVRAGQLKKAGFIVSGIGVAISTATARAHATISWIANLAAITANSIYSIFKNAETTKTIVNHQEEIAAAVEKLSLVKYRENPLVLAEVLPQVTAFNPEEIQRLERDTHKEFTREARQYAERNAVIQTLLDFIIIGVNVAENCESEDDASSATKNALSMFAILACILLQYGAHTMYFAKNLRKLATESEQLRTRLTTIRDSLFFRTFEYYEFVGCKERVEKKCADLELEISTAEQKIETLKNERQNLRRERNIVHQKQNELAEKCTSLDIRLYENLDTAQTRSLITKAIQELKIKGTTVEDYLYYIEVKRRYRTLGATITNLESEIENGNVDLAREKAKLEGLRAKHGKLTEEDGHFAEVVIDNDKFESMKRSFA